MGDRHRPSEATARSSTTTAAIGTPSRTTSESEQIEPGQTFETYLHFLSPECHAGEVEPGMPFEWREGARVVGRGVVLEVLELEQAAARVLERDPTALSKCREA